MPSYHIELRTHDRVWETLDIDRENQTDLRIEVARFVGELLRDHAGKIWEDKDWRVDVTDQSGLILFVMQLFVTDSAAAIPMRR
ncbi:DUF6894 family protein [Sphingomonas mucosissima]|uniref:DUF6894 domain-containing protein n=1 Tax=Sphingomonas mucosissima TaxID=370959 RepID=A0A245ZR31_9SPHN|nr:hypothetical protein [Sphingomonas mucosissima]OWK32196.1 hypothetical protein SPMU_05170 [Sphingomonas mucosissima]